MQIKEHPQLEGYGASRDGRVWSRRLRRWGLTESAPWRELKLFTNKKGYQTFSLGLVHRFVLECFVGPCPEGMECRHLDGNPSNNAIKNLKWGTRSQNAYDRVRHGTHVDNSGERHGMAKLTDDEAREILNDPRTQREIAADYGVSRMTVSRIKRRTHWTHI